MDGRDGINGIPGRNGSTGISVRFFWHFFIKVHRFFNRLGHSWEERYWWYTRLAWISGNLWKNGKIYVL